MDPYGLVRTPVPILKVMKIPAANAAVDTDCNKHKNVPVWSESKVRANAHIMHEAQKQKDLYTLFSNDGCKPPETLRVGSTFAKRQRKNRASRRHCATRHRVPSSISVDSGESS